MMNKGDINKISNDYVLKSLFAYVKYIKVLKLIANNKGLQKRLGINLNNYKEISNFPKYEYSKYEKIRTKRKMIKTLKTEYVCLFLLVCCITCIFLIYLFIYSILLVCKDSFNESNSKENFSKSTANTIKKINACTFILVVLTLATPLLLLNYIFIDLEIDYGVKNL